jgi:putative ABC transport system permease protein
MKIRRVLAGTLTILVGNKLRSGLTILGIVIGVAAVIAMLSVGQGAQNSITSSISSIGTNLLFLSAGSGARFGGGGGGGGATVVVRNIRPLTMSDAQALQDPYQAPDVLAVAPILQGGNISASATNGQSTTTTVYGVTSNYFSMRAETLTEGTIFSDQEVNIHARVAVIGPDLATTLFGVTTGVTGQTLRINGQTFTIIGVLKSKGGTALGSSDNQAIIPITTARDRVVQRVGNYVDTIYIQATSAATVTDASTQISNIMRLRHHVAVGAEDFSIFNQQDLANTASSIIGVLTVFLGGIAAISLLVGGIGIMNIMLVSVTERTREIGLRKAVGARNRDIMVQFLVESLFLSLLGGIMGILLGWLIALAIGRIASASGTSLVPAVSLNAILLATLFSAAVGLFFGIYPARRAAMLEPVEALRYE